METVQELQEEILSMRESLKRQRHRLKIYDDYYRGKHKILDYKTWNTRNSVKEVHNYCRLFIDNNTGFLLGNNVQMKYNTPTNKEDKPNLITEYTNLLGKDIQQINQKLLRDVQIYGYAFEINYINKRGEFDLAIKTPLDLYVKRQGNKVTRALLYQRTEGKKEIYDYFMVKEGLILTLAIEGKHVQIINKINNRIQNPVIVVLNNWEKQSEMEEIISLNDSYNQISSNITSEIEDFRNAYFHFKGASIDEDVLKEMNESGIISTNKDAEVKFVTKDINSDFLMKKLSQLENQIYNVSGQVNFNDTHVGSNTSSLALRNKLTNLMNKLKLKEGFLREALVLRLKNFSDCLKMAKSEFSFDEELYDYSKVDITFLLNIPTSDKETADMVIQLYKSGLLSMESAISQLSFINVAQDEINKIAGEEEALKFFPVQSENMITDGIEPEQNMDVKEPN